MIILVIIGAAILGLISWNYLINNPSESDLNIPVSNNIHYTPESIKPLTPGDLITEIDNNSGRPTLVYFYTLWCQTCKKQFPAMNEIARKFQNSDLKVIAVAVDNNINEQNFVNYLKYYKNIYFQPNYLLYSSSLIELLKEKSINYQNRIPYAAIIGRDSEIISSWTGYKSQRYINKRIIRSLTD